MEPVGPIQTVELFPPLSRELLAVLKTLRPSDWAQPTVCGTWTVKDVAAHLLGGNFGRIWKRDAAAAPSKISEPEYTALVDLINRENDVWVAAARRISPEILIELLELTDGHLYEHFRALDPDKPAGITVAWAGERVSANWFDIAREYTEKWLHQQHIREAVGQPLLLGRAWLFPVLDTFLRALPHTYRGIAAAEGTCITLQVTGQAGGAWSLLRENQGWHLFSGQGPTPACQVRMDQDLAWRVFTKGLRPEEARPRIQIEGSQSLGEQVLHMVAIMA